MSINIIIKHSGCKFVLTLPLEFHYRHLSLINRGRVTHICARTLDHHCFRSWLVACSAPSHTSMNVSFFVKLTLGDKFQWSCKRNTTNLIPENAFENVGCITVAIMYRSQYVNDTSVQAIVLVFEFLTDMGVIFSRVFFLNNELNLLPRTPQCRINILHKDNLQG